MTGQFSQVTRPLLKTDLTLRTLRMLTFGPNESTIIGKSSRVQMMERIIAQKKEGTRGECKFTKPDQFLYQLGGISSDGP